MSVLTVLKSLPCPEDEDGHGPRNVGFFAIQPLDTAGIPRTFFVGMMMKVE
jgi:hypothetical protein